TTFAGTFHGLNGGEMNLTTRSDGTWSISTWLCGPGGGGGGCNEGAWLVDGSGWKLVPAADSGATFRWGTHEVADVSVTIVNGVVHTVSSDGDTIDFKSGYRCYDSCEKNTFKRCEAPRQCR